MVDGVPERKRNSTIASLAGHLLWRQLTQRWCLNCSAPGTACAAGYPLKTPKFLKSSQTSSGFTWTRAKPVRQITSTANDRACPLKVRLMGVERLVALPRGACY